MGPLALDFELPPADAPRFWRAPCLKNRSRGRTTAHAVIWHDETTGALAAKNLIIAQVGSLFRLECLSPDAAHLALPAQYPPPLQSDTSLEALGHPDAQPKAGFQGSKRDCACGEVRVTLLTGQLRGITQEQATARVGLTGPAAETLALATQLAQETAIALPRAALAAQALALVQGQETPPRYLGTPLLPATAAIDDAIAIAIGWLTDEINYWAGLVPHATTPDPVHQLRVALRRLRSLLRICGRLPSGDIFAALQPDLRDLAAQLGAVRDWDVFLAGTGTAIMRDFPGERRVANLLLAATKAKAGAHKQAVSVLAAPAFRLLTLRLGLLCLGQPWRATDDATAADIGSTRDFAAQQLARLARPLLVERDLAALSVEELHDLRKKAKLLRYGCDIFAPFFAAKSVRKFISRLAELQEQLGTINDHVVACDRTGQLRGGPDQHYAAGVVAGYGAKPVRKARAESIHSLRKLQQESPFWQDT